MILRSGKELSIRKHFGNLFKLNAIPIVSENDTTATSEIKQNNDRLAQELLKLGADTLVILSDVDGL